MLNIYNSVSVDLLMIRCFFKVSVEETQLLYSLNRSIEQLACSEPSFYVMSPLQLALDLSLRSTLANDPPGSTAESYGGLTYARKNCLLAASPIYIQAVP